MPSTYLRAIENVYKFYFSLNLLFNNFRTSKSIILTNFVIVSGEILLKIIAKSVKIVFLEI